MSGNRNFALAAVRDWLARRAERATGARAIEWLGLARSMPIAKPRTFEERPLNGWASEKPLFFRRVGPPEHVFLHLEGLLDPFADSETNSMLSLIEPAERVTMTINSNGGCQVMARKLYDALSVRDSVCHVQGNAYSSSAFVLQGARHRTMTASSTLLLHSTQLFVIGPVSVVKGALKTAAEHDRFWLRVFETRTKARRGDLKRWLCGDETDWYFDAQESLRLGFVDELL